MWCKPNKEVRGKRSGTRLRLRAPGGAAEQWLRLTLVQGVKVIGSILDGSRLASYIGNFSFSLSGGALHRGLPSQSAFGLDSRTAPPAPQGGQTEASGLKGSLGQRRARVLCPSCGRPWEAISGREEKPWVDLLIFCSCEPLSFVSSGSLRRNFGENNSPRTETPRQRRERGTRGSFFGVWNKKT